MPISGQQAVHRGDSNGVWSGHCHCLRRCRFHLAHYTGRRQQHGLRHSYVLLMAERKQMKWIADPSSQQIQCAWARGQIFGAASARRRRRMCIRGFFKRVDDVPLNWGLIVRAIICCICWALGFPDPLNNRSIWVIIAIHSFMFVIQHHPNCHCSKNTCEVTKMIDYCDSKLGSSSFVCDTLNFFYYYYWTLQFATDIVYSRQPAVTHAIYLYSHLYREMQKGT